MRSYFVYIVGCKDNSLYVGITNDLHTRLWQHNTGIDPGSFVFNRRPVLLLHSEEFEDVWDAIGREKQLKRWNRRKKDALIAGDDDLLSKNAICMNGSNHRFYMQLACHAERSRSMMRDILCHPSATLGMT